MYQKGKYDPESRFVCALGRLEPSSLCSVCGNSDFIALLSHSDRYIPDLSGYECMPRAVAYIQQHRKTCIFCRMTDFCLNGLQLDKIPNSGGFTVMSLAFTTGTSVDNTIQSLESEVASTQSET